MRWARIDIEVGGVFLEDRPWFLGYHCGGTDKCRQFVQHGRLNIAKGRKQWLGEGMYFWDNAGNARWWQKRKHKKDPSYKTEIVKAGVYTDAMLDLSDPEHVDKIDKFYDDLWDLFHDPSEPEQEQHLGALLDALFEIDPEIGKLTVVKGIEDSGVNGVRPLLTQSMWDKPPHIAFGLRNQYCIKAESAIKKGLSCFVERRESICE